MGTVSFSPWARPGRVHQALQTQQLLVHGDCHNGKMIHFVRPPHLECLPWRHAGAALRPSLPPAALAYSPEPRPGRWITFVFTFRYLLHPSAGGCGPASVANRAHKKERILICRLCGVSGGLARDRRRKEFLSLITPALLMSFLFYYFFFVLKTLCISLYFYQQPFLFSYYFFCLFCRCYFLLTP